MNGLFVLKGQLQQIYAKYSRVIDKVFLFILALAAFFRINAELGYMEIAANPVIALGLAVVCAFLPAAAAVLFAAALILVHFYAVSLGIAAVTAVLFLVMFIFYLMFAQKMSLVVLITLTVFLLNIPYVAPIAFGLVGTPAYIVPITFGVIAYYAIDYVRASSAALLSADEAGILSQCTEYLRQLFQNKEMWVMILAFAVCVLVVYNVRRMAVAHSWKAGILSGVMVNVVFVVVGGLALGVHESYGYMLLGNAVAVLAGLILEFLFFSVDYSRTESLQYEDDEYYYYVKAVPKIIVAAPEKTVKRISRRDENYAETEIIDTGEIRKKTAGSAREDRRKAGRRPRAEGRVSGNTEELLLTQSLRRELDLDKK